MAKFVIAGRADCTRFARAEMLADTLQGMLPDMKVHKVNRLCLRHGVTFLHGHSEIIM